MDLEIDLGGGLGRIRMRRVEQRGVQVLDEDNNRAHRQLVRGPCGQSLAPLVTRSDAPRVELHARPQCCRFTARRIARAKGPRRRIVGQVRLESQEVPPGGDDDFTKIRIYQH